MNYQLLAEELAKEQYKDLDDQTAAEKLNAATVEVRRPVATRDIFIAAMRMGLIVTLRTVTLDAEMPAALRALAQTAQYEEYDEDDWIGLAAAVADLSERVTRLEVNGGAGAVRVDTLNDEWPGAAGAAGSLE